MEVNVSSQEHNNLEFSDLNSSNENSVADFPDSDLKEEKVATSNDDEWLDIMGSGEFKKKIINPGLGADTRPNRGDWVTVDLSCSVQGNLFSQEENLKFIVGDLDVIQGIDLVVCLMEKGEKAKVKIPSKLAYGLLGSSPDVPPNSEIECDIELKDVEPLDEDSLNVIDRLELGDKKRCRGNYHYERGSFIDAIHCYERAAEYLDGVRDGSDSTPEKLQEIVDMRIKVHNNLAASHLRLNAYSAALKSVDSVLKIQPKNVKALFRKAKILEAAQGSTDDAIACLKLAATLEPETRIIQTELIKLRNRKKKEEQSQKAMYQRMFKSDNKKDKLPVTVFKKWTIISCGILAVAIGSAVAFMKMQT